VDVRTVPRSRHNPQFGQDRLARSLHDAGIHYRHLPGLGGLRHPRLDSPNTGWRNAGFRCPGVFVTRCARCPDVIEPETCIEHGKQTAAAGTNKPEASSPGASPKNPDAAKTKPGGDAVDVDIKVFATELGITLKNKSAVVQSGNDDLVQGAMQRLIENYSTVRLKD
jgi:hypothetical protein